MSTTKETSKCCGGKQMFKYNISGNLALGYGSKFQLLRMLGWHQNWFNTKVNEALGLNGKIVWNDFEFNGPEDNEILNANFLTQNDEKEWEAIWPTNNGRNGINWDAIGTVDDGYVLVEAKAHLDECSGIKNGGGQNAELAKQTIAKFQKKYGINENDWTEPDYYQLANRLIFLDFIRERGYNARLVYVLFVNGYEFNTKNGENKSVKSGEKWESKFDELYEKMGIKNTVVEKMVDFCFVDCNMPKNR